MRKFVLSTLAIMLLSATTSLLSAGWDSIGSKANNGHCNSSDSKCSVNIKTHSAEIALITTATGEFQLSVNKKVVKMFEGYSITVEDIYKLNTNDSILVALHSGGMSCPTEFYFLQINLNSTYSISDSFGTCAEQYKANIDKDSVVIRMPSYFNPLHWNDLTPKQKKEVQQRKNSVYKWSNSVLTETVDLKRR